jgi:type VI secretion system protein ImpJ
VLADDIPQAIQWYEGMLLAPQHFQQSARRQELLVQYASLLVSPYCWGVRRLSIDTKLLPSGTYRILDLEAVLPDGSVVTHRPEDGRELMVDLTAFEEQLRQGELGIHLVLPARTPSGSKTAKARYDAFAGPPVSDENTGDGDVLVALLRPSLSLFAGDTAPPKYESIPLSKVRMDEEAHVVSDFIAPTMTVGLRSSLGDLCAHLVGRLREKAMFVSEQVRAPSAVLDMPLMVENRSRMQSLVTGLPALEALLSTGTAHPFTVYIALCSLAGHLAALGTSLLPPVFPAYNHADPRASFEEVVGFCLRMTNEGIPETYTPYPFQLKDRIFSLGFDGSWAERRLVLGMRTSTGVSEKEMIAWGDECLIGSESVVPSLRDKRIRGAQRQFVEKDQELVPVRGVVLFTLRVDAEFIKPGEQLQILNFGERGRTFSPLEIVLYVKRGG